MSILFKVFFLILRSNYKVKPTFSNAIFEKKNCIVCVRTQSEKIHHKLAYTTVATEGEYNETIRSSCQKQYECLLLFVLQL